MTRRAQRACVWSWVAAALAMACTGPSPDEQQLAPLPIVGPGESFDARGGTTTRHVSGWPVRVTMPAGAVSGPFALDIRPVDTEPGALFAADFTPSPFQFATPIEVAFDECALGDGAG